MRCGFRSTLRCESILTVGRAQRGEVLCPRCNLSGRTAVITRNSHDKVEVLKCPDCSWQTTWAAYLKTYQRKQLSEGQIGKCPAEFMQTYKSASSPRWEMLAIDALIAA